MNRLAFTLLLLAFPIFVGGCNLQTRTALDEQIEMLRNDIQLHKQRLAEIENLKSDIDQLRQKIREARVRNKKFVDETPGLRDKVKHHYREAEVLKY